MIKFTIPVKPRTKKNIGEKFGRLTVLEVKYIPDKTGRKRAIAFCQCECGNRLNVRLDAIKCGKTISCGCYHHDVCKQGCKPLKHGMTNSRLYNVWQGMKQRCYYPKHDHYKDYGGRGITICDEWKNDFLAFYNWAMKNGYDKNAPINQCTIDRIDVDGIYEPSNCRWVSQAVQIANKRKKGVKND